jgi:hypothetical protein
VYSHKKARKQALDDENVQAPAHSVEMTVTGHPMNENYHDGTSRSIVLANHGTTPFHANDASSALEHEEGNTVYPYSTDQELQHDSPSNNHDVNIVSPDSIRVLRVLDYTKSKLDFMDDVLMEDSSYHNLSNHSEDSVWTSTNTFDLESPTNASTTTSIQVQVRVPVVQTDGPVHDNTVSISNMNQAFDDTASNIRDVSQYPTELYHQLEQTEDVSNIIDDNQSLWMPIPVDYTNNTVNSLAPELSDEDISFLKSFGQEYDGTCTEGDYQSHSEVCHGFEAQIEDSMSYNTNGNNYSHELYANNTTDGPVQPATTITLPETDTIHQGPTLQRCEQDLSIIHDNQSLWMPIPNNTANSPTPEFSDDDDISFFKNFGQEYDDTRTEAVYQSHSEGCNGFEAQYEDSMSYNTFENNYSQESNANDYNHGPVHQATTVTVPETDTIHQRPPSQRRESLRFNELLDIENSIISPTNNEDHCTTTDDFISDEHDLSTSSIHQQNIIFERSLYIQPATIRKQSR